jgi:hypothetical protein
MKKFLFLGRKEESAPASNHQDYATSFTAIAASQLGLATLVGIIRRSA